MILSILICTLPERANLLDALVKDLRHQIHQYQEKVGREGDIEILFQSHPELPVGLKRNLLLAAVEGSYVVFIDDDDQVAPYYIEKIMEALLQDPDCVGMFGYMTTNGKDHRRWTISKEHGSWYEKEGVYYRTPNHISPVRKSIALKVRFPAEKSFGEDFDYSMGILPLLKTEVLIPFEMYHYRYQTKM
jgi:glycosyltransferase involved in cell wall biosynthesis